MLYYNNGILILMQMWKIICLGLVSVQINMYIIIVLIQLFSSVYPVTLCTFNTV